MPSHLKRKRASVEDQRQHEDHDDTTSEQVMMALSLCVINNETEEAPSKLQKEYKLQFSSLEKSKWLQITCYPSHFFTKFEEIRPSLSNNVLNILYSSPFGHFFLRNKDISMEKSLVQDIVSTYSTSRSVFVVGDLEINLGSEEACLLLGLPLVGNSVNLAKRGTSSDLRCRYSILHGRVTRQRLFSCIKEAISHKDDENAARLLIMFLFATILFPAPNSSVPTSLFEYVDDLYSLWSFKWGDEVLKYLLGGVRHVVGSRKAGKSVGQLHGCSLLLLAMFYYRSENPRVFCGRGLVPRLLNLDFKRTWKSLDKLSPFKEITIKAQKYEKWIISGSSRPTEWMDILLSTMSRKQRKEMNVSFLKSSSVRHVLVGDVPVEGVHRSNELEHNHRQLELRIAAYEVELMELKKQQDLNQRTLVEKINNLEKDSQLALVDFEQQRKDEMVEIQTNQLALVDKMNAFEQQHKDEMVEVQRYQLALVSKFDTFEKDNASLRSNVDLLFEKVMQKLEKLDKIDKMEEFIKEKFETKEDKEKEVNQDEVEKCWMTSGSPSSTMYRRRQKNPRKTIPTLKVLNKLRQVYSETEDKCNKTDEQTPFLEHNLDYWGRNCLGSDAQDLIDRFLKDGIHGKTLLSTPSAQLSDKDLHSILYGRSLSDDAITSWFYLQKQEQPTCKWEGKIVDWEFLPANLSECYERQNKDFLQLVCGKDLQKMAECKLIFVPLNLTIEWHWHLLAVDYVSKTFRFYDAANPRSNKTEMTPLETLKLKCAMFLCSVLSSQLHFPNASKFKVFFCRDLAQQPVGSVACGIYTCLYLQKLIRNDCLQFEHNYAMQQRGFVAHKFIEAARKSTL